MPGQLGPAMNPSVASYAEVPKRVSEVQREVERGNSVTKSLDSRIQLLVNRLNSVLRSVAEEDANPAQTRPVLVSHANALSNHNDQLEMMDSYLASILDRLEL